MASKVICKEKWSFEVAAGRSRQFGLMLDWCFQPKRQLVQNDRGVFKVPRTAHVCISLPFSYISFDVLEMGLEPLYENRFVERDLATVTGGKYPSDRWIVVDDNDEVVFDPAYCAGDVGETLKACSLYVRNPESREELRNHYGRRTDHGWDTELDAKTDGQEIQGE